MKQHHYSSFSFISISNFGFTQRETIASKFQSEDKIVSSSGTYSASSTLSASDGWGCIVATFIDAVLPVTLLDFTAACDNDRLNFNWTTASESNNAYFTVECSANTLDFYPLAVVRGAGNSSMVKNYSYYVAAEKTFGNYFRLKQTDYDGTEEVFWTVFSDCGIHPQIIIYPAITDGKVFISGSNDAEIVIYSALGQKITAHQTSNGIDLSGQPAGIYFLYVKGQDRVVKKIIKK